MFSSSSAPSKEFGRLQEASDHLFRISTADRYAANLKAERGLQQEGDYLSRFNHCYQPCTIHKVHSCVKASSVPFAEDVSGLLNCGLACQDVGATKTLRAILVSILLESLDVSYTPAPRGEAERYRQQAHDLYLPIHGVPKPLQRSNQKRRKILEYFLNSDLQETTRITHHCSPSCCRSEQETRRHLSHFVSWALIPQKLPVLSRKSWTGFQPALTWAGVLHTHHNLFQRVMGVYLGVPVTGPAAQEQPVLHRSGADAWLDSVMEDEAENVPAPPPLPRDAPESAPGVSEPVDWAELRREQRRTAKTWVATVPGPRLANLNDTSGPLQELLSKFLYISSDKWEQQQRLHAMQSGDRSYAVLELASGSDVSKAMEETLRKCLEAIPAVPSALVDIPLKIQRFCAMSCGASALHALLRLPAQGMPYQFFKLLKERRVGELLDERQWPKCMLDSLARAMLVKFPTAAALKSDECQAIAEVLSMMFDSDISDIECRHAQTRDHSKVRARGWVPSLETLAAKFALRGSNHARYNPEPGSRSWKTRTPKKKKGGGGAWRAFVQQHAEGVRSAAELPAPQPC